MNDTKLSRGGGEVKGRQLIRLGSLDSECYFDAMNLAISSALYGRRGAILCRHHTQQQFGRVQTVNTMLSFEFFILFCYVFPTICICVIKNLASFITCYVTAFKRIVL